MTFDCNIFDFLTKNLFLVTKKGLRNFFLNVAYQLKGLVEADQGWPAYPTALV